MKKKAFSVIVTLVILMSLVSCSNSKDKPGLAAPGKTGVIYVGQTRMAPSLNAVDSSVPWSLTSHGISETVYKQDENGKLVSRFLSSLKQIDGHKWEATVYEGVKFSDGSEVDAGAICAAMNKVMAENALASTGGAGKMEFTKTGDYSLTITTEKVTRIMESNLCEWTNILFKDLGNGEYAFTGPYMAKSFDPAIEIQMTPNPYYPNAEKRSDVTIKVFKDMSAMKLAVESGEIEMASTITADVKQMLEAEGVKVQTIDAGYQYMLELNQEREFIRDMAVRKALNLAIDRNVLIQALKGGRLGSGIFARYYSFAGDDEPVFDLEQARKTLDDGGWKLNAEGIREKDGRKLSLKMISYTMRPDLPVMMQIITSQIKELGIDIASIIVSNITEAGKAGDFDLYLYAQHTAPTGDPAYFMTQKYFKSSPNNFCRYASDEFEAIVNEMGDLPHGEQRDELARKAQDLLLKDLPVIFLIDPQWHIAVSGRLENYKPYCGDYYTINEKLGML